MRLKNDKRLRDNLFTPESYQHPAKGHLGLWQAIIEKYTLPGETILDPMAGVGATLTAAIMGRNVVCMELEPHFIAPMKASWEKMRQHPMLGYALGEVLILRGDARHLPIGSADHIVTSPPFEDQVPNHLGGDTDFSQIGGIGHEKVSGYTRPSAIITSPPYEASEVAQSSDGEANRRFRAGEYTGDARKGMGLSKGYTRPVDAVISSPPYEGSIAQGKDGIDWSVTRREDGTIRDRTKESSTSKTSVYRGYTRKPVDAVVTSPPYENTIDGAGKHAGPGVTAKALAWQLGIENAYGGYSETNLENVGNLRGSQYWTAMSEIYQECHRVLRPGGLLCLVLKGFTRNGVYQDLPQQTADLVESLGFTLFDTWRRELWSLSFWRILQRRRDPAAFDNRLNYESVMAFRKE